jgi:hypothetical protein
MFVLVVHGLIFSMFGEGLWDKKTGEPDWRMQSPAPWLIGALVICFLIGAGFAPMMGWMCATMFVPFVLGAWDCNRPRTIARRKAEILEKAQKEEQERVERQQQAYLQAVRPVYDPNQQDITGPAKEIAQHLHDLLRR